jgi:hypothetical protein
MSAGPFASRLAGGDAVVQLDIAREPSRRGRGERFRLWRGAADNRVEALGMDRRLMQLVLLVHEPRRAFELEVSSFAAVPRGVRVLREGRRTRVVESFTTDRKRHFLLGMDEQHLFVALLPDPVSTVRAAHESLRDPRVVTGERRAQQPTVRQGEWFFVALTPQEERDVDAEVGRGLRVAKHVGIAQAAGIRRIGRPHVADEVFVSAAARDEDGSPRAYVREAIEQPIPGVAWID